MLALRVGRASPACVRRSPLAVMSSRIQTRCLTIGIRREAKGRWERRVPLNPGAVKQLIKDHSVKVLVQPSPRRVFNDDKYAEAGATICEDLGPADVVMGIKEVQPADMIPGKTYMYFSHTHKGQPHNMHMLKAVLDKKIHLVDYELITDDERRRLVLFGRYAGLAGMTDGLHGLGSKMLGLGYNTPFLHVGMSHTYPSVNTAQRAISEAGEMIRRDGLPKQLAPAIFVFTGTGNVSMGAQEMFKSLPHQYVTPSDLPKLVQDSNPRLDRVYAAEVSAPDWVTTRDGHAGPRDAKRIRKDYYAHPEKYKSEFHSKIAPYATMLIAGAYWDNKFPRLMTTENLRELQYKEIEGRGRLLSVADISCDIKGGLEFMSHATTIDDPFFYVDAVKGIEHKNVEQPGLQILSVDNLPTEFPLEASNHFSKCLFPFVKEMAKGNWDHPVLKRATIAEGGNLVQSFTHLKSAIEKSMGSSPSEKVTCTTRGRESKRVLLLGSGMVAGPLVDYLSSIEDVHVVIASNARSEATALAKGRDRTEVVNLDVANAAMVSQLVSRADVVVSLVPAPLHPTIALSCIKNRKHMVTASYISPAMLLLDADAKQAGVAIMNEIGLDPGIDHLTAMRTIDEVKHEGGKVKSFVSWCGGLPAPESSDLPLAYKFSWSPRGVLTAGTNASRFKMAGKVEEVPGHRLLPSHFPTVPLGFSGFAFEGLANRDALQYTDTYDLPPVDAMETMFRGTLRYKGFADMMYRFSRLGFLGTANMGGYEFRGWPDFLDNLLAPGARLTDGDREKLVTEKAGFPGDDPNAFEKFRNALRFFDLLPGQTRSSDVAFAPPANTLKTPLDMFCALLSRRLRYLPGERDMVVLQHEFGVETRNGERVTRTSTLIAYGGQHTAMARTVGYPAAMATELLLRGKIPERGVLAPVLPHVYTPIIEQLEREGIRVTESTRKGNGMVQAGLRYRDAGWP